MIDSVYRRVSGLIEARTAAEVGELCAFGSWYPVPSPTPASCAGVIDRSGSAWLAVCCAIVDSPSICLRVIVKVAVCGAIVDSPSICLRVSVKVAGTRCDAETLVDFDTAPDVPLSNATAVTTAVTQAARAAATPISPSRWPRLIWTVAGMEAETLMVVLPSE